VDDGRRTAAWPWAAASAEVGLVCWQSSVSPRLRTRPLAPSASVFDWGVDVEHPSPEPLRMLLFQVRSDFGQVVQAGGRCRWITPCGSSVLGAGMPNSNGSTGPSLKEPRRSSAFPASPVCAVWLHLHLVSGKFGCPLSDLLALERIHRMATPPSTNRVVPVTKSEAREAK